MTRPLPDNLRVGPIRSADEARKWIKALHDADLSFQFDDSPETVCNFSRGLDQWVRLFLDEDVPLVRARVAELFDFDFDPFAFALALGWAGCERHEWETDASGQPHHPKRCSKCGYDSEIAEGAWR